MDTKVSSDGPIGGGGGRDGTGREKCGGGLKLVFNHKGHDPPYLSLATLPTITKCVQVFCIYRALPVDTLTDKSQVIDNVGEMSQLSEPQGQRIGAPTKPHPAALYTSAKHGACGPRAHIFL